MDAEQIPSKEAKFVLPCLEQGEKPGHEIDWGNDHGSEFVQ